MDYLIDFPSKKLIEAIVVYILIFKIYSDFVNQFYIYIIISNFTIIIIIMISKEIMQ